MTRLPRRWGAGAAVALCAGVTAWALGRRAFGRLVAGDVRALLEGESGGDAGLVTEEMLVHLPNPVQRYLRFTGVVGRPIPRTVRLTQKGRMRLGAGRVWIPLEARQWYTVQPPGFVWEGTLHLGGIGMVRARDMYRAGHGHMLIKAASFLTVADARGEEMDQGSMMRYLSEIAWFPSAFVADNISWEAVDTTSARATLTHQGRTATATLFFDTDGRLTEFVGRRYATAGEGLQEWSVPVVSYGELEGLRLPVRVKAVWKLADGDQEYIDVTVTDLEYDV